MSRSIRQVRDHRPCEEGDRPGIEGHGSAGVAVANAEGERGRGEQPERRSIGRALDRVADADGDLANRESISSGAGLREAGPERHGYFAADCDGPGRMEHAKGERWREGRAAAIVLGRRDTSASADVRHLVDADGKRREELGGAIPVRSQQPRAQRPIGRNGSWWADAEWIACHDGKTRRAKPGVPMLVDGLPGRVALWRLAGNAISPVLAAEVIAAFLDAEAAMLRG